MRSPSKMRWIRVDSLHVGDAILQDDDRAIIVIGVEKIPYHIRFKILVDGNVYTEDRLPGSFTWGCLLRGTGRMSGRSDDVTGGRDPEDLNAEQESASEEHDPPSGLGEGLDSEGD